MTAQCMQHQRKLKSWVGAGGQLLSHDQESLLSLRGVSRSCMYVHTYIHDFSATTTGSCLEINTIDRNTFSKLLSRMTNPWMHLQVVQNFFFPLTFAWRSIELTSTISFILEQLTSWSCCHLVHTHVPIYPAQTSTKKDASNKYIKGHTFQKASLALEAMIASKLRLLRLHFIVNLLAGK
jgi:hypothetical protein